MLTDLFPGDVVLTQLPGGKVEGLRIYGMIVDKINFLDKFTKLRGPWPTGEKLSDFSLRSIFGSYLPVVEDDNINYGCVVAGEDVFLESEEHFGIKVLGNPYDQNLDRALGLEVVGLRDSSATFSRYDLENLIKTRDFLLEEDSFESQRPISHLGRELLYLNQFVEGKYKNLEFKDGNVEGTNAYIRDFVLQLRSLGIMEELHP